MRSKYTNLLVLVGLLALVAVIMRGQRPTATPLQADLEDALRRVWGNVTCQVVVRDSGIIEVRQNFPAGTRPARRHWSYEIVRFVVHAHPDFTIKELLVTDLESGQGIQEDPPTSGSLEDPQYFELASTETKRRNAQFYLDQECGDRALLLVDVIAGSARRGRSRMRARAAPPIDPGEPEIARIESLLVVRGMPPARPHQIVVERLPMNAARGDTLRDVELAQGSR